MNQRELAKFFVDDTGKIEVVIIRASGTDPPKYILYKVAGNGCIKVQSSENIEKSEKLWEEKI